MSTTTRKQAKWPMINVRQPGLPQWRRIAERPANRCLIPLTEFAEWTPDANDVGGGKPIEGEMWFSVIAQPVFAVAGLCQQVAGKLCWAMVTCAPNALVASVHPKAMITVLEVGNWDRWLRGGYDEAVALQRPYPAARMAVRGPVTVPALILKILTSLRSRAMTIPKRLSAVLSADLLCSLCSGGGSRP